MQHMKMPPPILPHLLPLGPEGNTPHLQRTVHESAHWFAYMALHNDMETMMMMMMMMIIITIIIIIIIIVIVLNPKIKNPSPLTTICCAPRRAHPPTEWEKAPAARFPAARGVVICCARTSGEAAQCCALQWYSLVAACDACQSPMIAAGRGFHWRE